MIYSGMPEFAMPMVNRAAIPRVAPKFAGSFRMLSLPSHFFEIF
jgi:hypothetical protein